MIEYYMFKSTKKIMNKYMNKKIILRKIRNSYINEKNKKKKNALRVYLIHKKKKTSLYTMQS